jgi:hypothetical protein
MRGLPGRGFSTNELAIIFHCFCHLSGTLHPPWYYDIQPVLHSYDNVGIDDTPWGCYGYALVPNASSLFTGMGK